MKALKKIDKSRLIAISNEKILVFEKSALTKKYSLAGGVKKSNETDCQSLIRETHEEIGVKLKKKDLSYFISRMVVEKDNQDVYKHYFISYNVMVENVEVSDPHIYNRVLWVPWYGALKYLDKEDRKVVTLYFDQFKEKKLINGSRTNEN